MIIHKLVVYTVIFHNGLYIFENDRMWKRQRSENIVSSRRTIRLRKASPTAMTTT